MKNYCVYPDEYNLSNRIIEFDNIQIKLNIMESLNLIINILESLENCSINAPQVMMLNTISKLASTLDYDLED